MNRCFRLLLPLATAALVSISLLAVLPWLGRPAPSVSAQTGGLQFGGGGGCSFGPFQFGGLQSGRQFGGCSFGGGAFNVGTFQFQGGGFNFGGIQFGGGFQFGQVGGQFGQFGQVGGQFGQGGFNLGQFGFGAFVLLGSDSSVEVGEPVFLLFAWEVPPPETWRDLRTLEVRFRNDGRTVFQVRWDEADNTFSLIDPASGRVLESGTAGSSGRLENAFASLDLEESGVEDTGEGGTGVAVLLSVTFKERAAGHTFRVQERATSDAGQVQGFDTVGTLSVLARNRDEDDGEQLTEQQKRERERTNNIGDRDDEAAGTLMAARCDRSQPVPQVLVGLELPFDREATPAAYLASGDGIQQVQLLGEAAKQCAALRPGRWAEFAGWKEHEQLFFATEVQES